MRISDISEVEINLIRDILVRSRYVLLRENDREVYFPLFRPEVLMDLDRLTIRDELGYEEEYPNYFEIFIGEIMIIINSPDCTKIDSYYSVYRLEEIEKSYWEILRKRVIESIFKQEIDLSDFTEQSIGFIIELIRRMKEVEMTKSIIEKEGINIQINRTKVEIGFRLWNLEKYLELEEVLEYSVKIKIPDFNIEIEANSIEYLIMKLYDELEVRGVRRW